MSATIIDKPEKFSFPTMVKLGCFAAIAVGLITFGLSFIGGSDVAFGGWAIASWYVVGFPLFAMFFLSINHLANAGWHVTLKRVPEAMTTYFLPGLLTFAVLCLSFLDWRSPAIRLGPFEPRSPRRALRIDSEEGRLA